MMNRRLHYVEYILCHLLVTFAVGRLAFMWYNRELADFGLLDVLQVLKDGLLSHDFGLATILLLIPALLGIVASRRPLPLRALLSPYYVIVGFLVAVILVADMILYEFWQFHLSSVVLAYAASPEGTTNSVSVGFLAVRIVFLLVFVLWLVIPPIYITPSRLNQHPGAQQWMKYMGMIVGFMSVLGVLSMRVGDAYRSGRNIFLNHAAANPVLVFATSFHLSDDYSRWYDFLDEAERFENMQGLYPEDTEDVADTLLNTQHPNVLIVFLEGMGGRYISELGGLPDVAPQWSRLIPEGIFWTNFYSTSFRTDRGTVSTFSAMPGYPDVALMKETALHASIPSLPRSMADAGYETSFLFGCAMTNMGKREYMQNIGFQHLYDDTFFRPEEITEGWGASDSVSAQKAFRMIAEKDTASRWMLTYQTTSSHEPWEVPYHRLKEKQLNAFAYTDDCLGRLVDSLRTTPQWDNLLIIMLPDHGTLYHQSFEDPEFFHSPMLWLGGAIKEPRTMDVWMNQNDVAATLLSQLGISHREYRWSRNVLSRNYRQQFVTSNFPAGIMFRDAQGYTIYDLSADRIISQGGAPDPSRVSKAQAILQTTYDDLQERRDVLR